MRITLVVLLLLYSVFVSMAGTHWLTRATWPVRAPRAGIAIWLAGALSVAATAAAAGIMLAIPCMQWTTDLAALGPCLSALRVQYASPAGALAGTAGSLLALTVIGRLVWFCGSALKTARQRRAIHEDALTLVARPGPAPDVAVIDDARLAAYCVPGHRRIVLTTGAMTHLDSRQLDAVLAHERAHISGRHHLIVTLATSLRQTLPAVRFFAAAARQVSYLVEVAADDAAARRTPRLTVAAALLAVASADAPAWALGAGGSATAQRIDRLINPPRQGSFAQRALICAALAATAALAVTGLTLAVVTLLRCPT